jgi:hypothetical protein
MLRGLGLELFGRRDERHERHVDVGARAAWQLEAHLADRLEEGQALDVADRAADLDEHDVGVVEPVAA